MPLLALIAGYIVATFVGALAFFIVLRIFQGKIDLRYLISEEDGSASFSRFQFLIFTFVISVCLLVLTLESGEFPKLSQDVLALLGISAGSYLVSKGIQRSGDATPPDATDDPGLKLPK